LNLVSRLESSQPSGYFPDMPIYEFHCEDCNMDSEILVRSRDWNGTKCPRCGSLKLAKKFSTFASATAGAAPNPGPTSCMAKPSGCGCGRGGPHRH
jgi:putative FmdB family regulatory protein